MHEYIRQVRAEFFKHTPFAREDDWQEFKTFVGLEQCYEENLSPVEVVDYYSDMAA